MQSLDIDDAVTESEWLAGPHSQGLYVWLHVDEHGMPFYVGRGRGSTAWNRAGGPAWEYYVRERLGGRYHILIPARGLDDQGSQAVLEKYLERYGPVLLNQTNYNRGMDMVEYEKRRVLNDQLRPLYDRVRNAPNVESRIELAKRGLDLQYQMNRLRLETGLFGEVLREMGADCSVNQFFIKPLIEDLVELRMVEEARGAVKQYAREAPSQTTSSTFRRAHRIAERGTFNRKRRASRP